MEALTLQGCLKGITAAAHSAWVSCPQGEMASLPALLSAIVVALGFIALPGFGAFSFSLT